MTFANLRVSVSLWLKNHRLDKISWLILTAMLSVCFSASAQVENIKETILGEVNKLRASGCQCGDEYMSPAGPLVWNELLEKAAVRHAGDMADHTHFDHVGTDKSTLSDRIEDTGYVWSTLGENISFGYPDATSVVHGWKGSDGHCKNMMNPVFKELGAARNGTFWVLDLGTQK